MLYVIRATLSCKEKRCRERIYFAKTTFGLLLKVLYCKMFYDWVEVKELYHCDPAKNTKCSKSMCHINGGLCEHTVIKEYSTED